MSNTLPFDPLSWLKMRAQNSNPAASPVPAPAQAAPAPMAGAPAAASPVPSGGGGGSMLGNIGTRLSDAISGRQGLFASAPDATADAAIDPMTGAPAGVSRQATNQSIMKMGLMLVAAGQRQSDDSRARILAGLGGAMDTSDTINNFARNRLEMAKIKLLEREQLGQEQARKAFGSMFADSPAGASSSPVAGTAADPAALAPVAAAATPGMAPSAPVTSSPLPPLDGPSSRVSGAFDTTAPAGVPAATPSAMPAAGMAPVVVSGAALPSKAPPAPPAPSMELTPEEKKMGQILLNTDPTTKTAQEYLKERQKSRLDTEVAGEPYTMNGMIVQDVYKNGRKVDTKKLGEVPAEVVISKGPNGETIVQKKAGDMVTDFDVIRDPVADDAATRANKRNNPDLPSGYELDPTKPGAIRPMVGGEDERKAKDAAEKAKLAKSGKDKYNSTVRQDIDRIFVDVEKSRDSWFPAVGGVTPAITSRIPMTAASGVSNALETVKANIGFSRLQEMREASPTGGALGNVTEGEVNRLDATYGKLAQTQDPDVFEFNLARIRNMMDDAIHGPGNGPERIDLDKLPGAVKVADLPTRLGGDKEDGAPAGAASGKEGRANIPPAPAGWAPDEWGVLTPEERAQVTGG